MTQMDKMHNDSIRNEKNLVVRVQLIVLHSVQLLQLVALYIPTTHHMQRRNFFNG